MAQISCGVFTAIIVLLLARPASYIPIPLLSAVVIYSALGLIDVAQIRRLIAGTRSDAVVLVITVVWRRSCCGWTTRSTSGRSCR